MPKFKLHRRETAYYSAYVEAATKKEALLKADEINHWDFVEADSEEIIAIDEFNDRDEKAVYHYLEDGEFYDSVPIEQPFREEDIYATPKKTD